MLEVSTETGWKLPWQCRVAAVAVRWCGVPLICGCGDIVASIQCLVCSDRSDDASSEQIGEIAIEFAMRSTVCDPIERGENWKRKRKSESWEYVA